MINFWVRLEIELDVEVIVNFIKAPNQLKKFFKTHGR
jgi:hypothetical protein